VRILIFGSVLSVVLLWAVSASGSGSKAALSIPDFTVAQLSVPGGANWPLENGNLQSWRYTSLSQINASNGGNLKLAWTTHIPDPATPERVAAANEMPLVYNGVVYGQDMWYRVTAMDGTTGKILWQFDPQIGLNVGGTADARFLGMGDGMVFDAAFGTIYALDAKTGTQVWATQVQDPIGGANIDASPLYYKGLVITGTAGGDSGASCIAVALDAKTGKVKWHYSLIPGNPKAFGWNTWPSTRWYYGGAAVWDPPTISPTTGYIYLGTGQPLPFNGLMQGVGKETGTNGVYALDALTGQFKWWYQEVHHDIWDYDAMQTPIVENITKNGQTIEVVDHINKNAYNYVLNSKTGVPVNPTPETPVPQEAAAHTWATQPIPAGDPLTWRVAPDPQNWTGTLAPDGKPFIVATVPFTPYTTSQYVVVGPGTGGGVEWPESAWDPNSKLEVACANNQSQAQESPPVEDQHPIVKAGAFGNITQLRTTTVPTAETIARIVAFNPATNTIVWKHDEVSTGGIANGNAASCASAVTTTASGLAIIGRVIATSQYPNGVAAIQAFSMKDGSLAWQVPMLVNGQAVPTVPRLTPYAVNGKEYLVSFTNFATAGADVSAFALP
jgi:glucose dehydrogenase